MTGTEAIMRTLVLLCAIVLASTLSVFAQGTIDKQRVYHPTEEELAANKRLSELLRHPTFITLRLLSMPRYLPRENPTDAPAPYKVKDLIGFQLLMTQSSSEKITIWNYMSPYYEYRPELSRDGDILPYGKKAQERVERAEREAPSGSMRQVTLRPGHPEHWIYIDLEDWYESLTPGRYQLTVRKQFAWDGDWVVSSPVIFEVQPRTPGAPIPTGVKIEMVPEGVEPKTDGKTYRLGTDVYIRGFVVNNSDQPVKVSVVDRYYGNRPQLFKDGVLIPYREETAKLISSKDENPRLVDVANDFFLDSGTRSGLLYVKLKEWYDPLSPGSYRLVNRQRFEIDGPWTADSAELLFEVVPKQSSRN